MGHQHDSVALKELMVQWRKQEYNYSGGRRWKYFPDSLMHVVVRDQPPFRKWEKARVAGRG